MYSNWTSISASLTIPIWNHGCIFIFYIWTRPLPTTLSCHTMLKIAATLYGTYVHRKKNRLRGTWWWAWDWWAEGSGQQNAQEGLSISACKSVMQLRVLDFSPLSRFLKEVWLKYLSTQADLQNVVLPYNDLALQYREASSHFHPQQFNSSAISATSSFGISLFCCIFSECYQSSMQFQLQN